MKPSPADKLTTPPSNPIMRYRVVVADGPFAGAVVTSGLVPWTGTKAEAEAMVVLMGAQAADSGHATLYEVVELNVR